MEVPSPDRPADAALPPARGPAFESWWAEQRRWLAASMLAHLPRRGAQLDIDDLLQEVALRVLEHGHTLQHDEKIRAWLRAVALNVLRDAGRRRAVRRSESLDSPEAEEAIGIGGGGDVESWIERDGVRCELARTLRLARRLPSSLAEPLLLRAVRGLSQREVAETLAISERAVESRLARARKRLKDSLRATLAGRIEDAPPAYS